MKNIVYFKLALISVLFSACAKQTPAPVVEGYGYGNDYSQYNSDINKVDFQSEAERLSKQEEEYYFHGGDSLDEVAKHFGVTTVAILDRNNLKTEADLKVGTYIKIPTPSWKPKRTNFKPNTYRLSDRFKKEEKKVVLDSYGDENYIDSKPKNKIELMRKHVLKEGENIFRLALKYNVSQFDILAANDIRNPADLKAGMVINIPQSGEKVAGSDNYKKFAVNNNTPVVNHKKNELPKLKKMRPNELNEKATFANNYYSGLAKTYKNRNVKTRGMIWPADGTIIKSFGKKGRGVNHTGINIALKENAPIYAVENGSVIYSDNGLELYGNLILIQHKNGYVTAYAHNSKNLVKRHQKVKKGDLIAVAGSTGNVKRVQLHFEVRKNAQAINPLKVLPKK